MDKLRISDVNWDDVYDTADYLLKTYNIPHRVSRYQKEIYRNRPVCFLIIPHAWNQSIIDEIRSVPGVQERKSFNTVNGRYRRFAIFTS